MRTRQLSVSLLVSVLWLAVGTATADAAKIGVVLMHGNASWGGQFVTIRDKFIEAGYGLETPDMCWSDTRMYAGTPEACMADVDAAIERLREQGYEQFVVAGHSMGASNALFYGANHHEGTLAGIIAMSPRVGPRGRIHDPIGDMARELVAQGKGNEPTYFPRGFNEYRATPLAYLGFAGDESPLNATELMPRLAAPLLYVAGTDDGGQRRAHDVYNRMLPPNPLNEFLVVGADHMMTPDIAVDQVIDWLNRLSASLDVHLGG